MSGHVVAVTLVEVAGGAETLWIARAISWYKCIQTQYQCIHFCSSSEVRTEISDPWFDFAEDLYL